MTPQKEAAAASASYVTSAILGLWGLTVNEWVTIAGLFLGAATFAINWRYKHLSYKLEKEKTGTIHD